SLKVWWVIRAFGLSGLRSRMEHQLELAAWLRQQMEAHPDFETLDQMTAVARSAQAAQAPAVASAEASALASAQGATAPAFTPYPLVCFRAFPRVWREAVNDGNAAVSPSGAYGISREDLARAKSSREIPYAPEGLTAAFPSLTASRHTRGNARKHTSGYGVNAGAVAPCADANADASADATAGACAACADRATAVIWSSVSKSGWASICCRSQAASSSWCSMRDRRPLRPKARMTHHTLSERKFRPSCRLKSMG